MKKFMIAMVAVVGLMMSVVGFAQDISSSGYGYDNVRQSGSGVPGTVIEVRKVNIGPSQTAVMAGRISGAAIGGAVSAAATGNNTLLKIAATALGGVGGGIVGDKAADFFGSQEGLEIMVETNGRVTVVTQSLSDGNQFYVGDNVWLINSGGSYRIVHRSQQPAAY